MIGSRGSPYGRGGPLALWLGAPQGQLPLLARNRPGPPGRYSIRPEVLGVLQHQGLEVLRHGHAQLGRPGIHRCVSCRDHACLQIHQGAPPAAGATRTAPTGQLRLRLVGHGGHPSLKVDPLCERHADQQDLLNATLGWSPGLRSHQRGVVDGVPDNRDDADQPGSGLTVRVDVGDMVGDHELVDRRHTGRLQGGQKPRPVVRSRGTRRPGVPKGRRAAGCPPQASGCVRWLFIRGAADPAGELGGGDGLPDRVAVVVEP